LDFLDFSVCDFSLVFSLLSIAAEQRDDRVKFILEADVISSVKTVLTSVPRSRQLAVRLVAELVKTGTSVTLLRSSMLIHLKY